MTTTTAVDPVTRWILDIDGGMYGDERERRYWYEGIALTANLQWIAVPATAAVLVWILGQPSVLPLAVVLGVMYLLTLVVLIYVRAHRVDPRVAHWSPGNILRGALPADAYLAFALGAMRAYESPERPFLPGAGVGMVVGAVLAIVILALFARQRRRREAAPMQDED
jgi:hypothetical protein